tara:strand:- start:6 stop:617 length:612 start_codon:yes stop_codon:yes gene_type:complete
MSTYANLVQDIKDWTENNGTDFADEIDRFIDNTELRLSKELIDCPALRRHATSSLTVNDPFINKPSGLNTTISLQILSSSVRSALEYRDIGFINEYWPNRSTTGTPKYFSNWDETFFIIAPTPGAALSVEINYRERFTTINSSNTTNWLTDNAYDVLLYGALIEAAVYNKDAAQQQVYQQRYAESLQATQAEIALKNKSSFTG